MPIRSYLNGQRFDPETMRLMGLAYEMTLISLGLLIAATWPMMSLRARSSSIGERDPERLCEAVLNQWRAAIPQHVAPPIALRRRQKSYELQANCYLRPTTSSRALIRGVIDFWLTKAKLPS